MKAQFNEALEYLKNLKIDACITGSSMLGYMENEKQDIDMFCYSLPAFTELYYELYHNKMFCITDELEKWKSDSFRKREQFSNKHHTGVTTIKFLYNTCIEVNIILKKNCDNIFSVLSSFDMDLISKGFCLRTQQYLDLSGDSGVTRIANYNKWNPLFNNNELWSVSRVLRQLDRAIKYYKRGYNTDPLVNKYLELIDNLQKFESIFASETFNEKLEITKENTMIVKQICQVWLETHNISEEQHELLKKTIKTI